jgi:hypothetical protein
MLVFAHDIYSHAIWTIGWADFDQKIILNKSTPKIYYFFYVKAP